MQLTRDIMRLNHTPGELNDNNLEEYNEWLYWITVMGEPSADEPWGWQLDGHHVVIIKMEEISAHIDDTWFAWVGGTGDDTVFYHRILSPVILIEFDHQRPANLRHLYPPVPSRQHIHAVMRTPNGKDLLKQHYEKHSH